MSDKPSSVSFKDAVVDAHIAKVQEQDRFALGCHETIYPNSSDSAVIRKLLVDFAVWGWKDGLPRKMPGLKEYPEFLFDVATALH